MYKCGFLILETSNSSSISSSSGVSGVDSLVWVVSLFVTLSVVLMAVVSVVEPSLFSFLFFGFLNKSKLRSVRLISFQYGILIFQNSVFLFTSSFTHFNLSSSYLVSYDFRKASRSSSLESHGKTPTRTTTLLYVHLDLIHHGISDFSLRQQ